MGIPLECLPPKAREQVAKKMLQEAASKPPSLQKSKYGNKKATRRAGENEVVFDSQKEARRFDELMYRLRAGDIRELKLQPEFTIRESYTTPEGIKVRAIRYRADFSYEERVHLLRSSGKDIDGEEVWRKVIEDVKSEATKTRVYAIKKKLLIEQGISIREI